jgi:heme/copper-type cytochrome/quinol oxidase subunit 2
MTFGRAAAGQSAPCSFFCGFGHAGMRFRVEVLDPPAFRAWRQRRRAEAGR